MNVHLHHELALRIIFSAVWSDCIEYKNKCSVVISCMENQFEMLPLFTRCILQLPVRCNIKLNQKLSNVFKEFSLK